MSNYTPPTAEVRSAFVRDPWTRRWSRSSDDASVEETTRLAQEAFDRWLTAHDADLRKQIAQEILGSRPEYGRHINETQYRNGKFAGMSEAARIARGQEQD